MPESQERDTDKEELARRLRDAADRLQRLEWQADVIRRQGAADKKESP